MNTLWDIAKVLEEAATAIRQVPGNVMREISVVEEASLERLEATTKEAMEKIEAYGAQLDQLMIYAAGKADDSYRQLQKLNASMRDRLSALGDIQAPSVYGIEQYLDALERMSKLSDEDIERCRRMANAIAGAGASAAEGAKSTLWVSEEEAEQLRRLAETRRDDAT